MENTENLEIDVEDIGTILKSTRLKQKKSMEEISSELCIRKIYLTALEESDYETLPPIPYGVGYMRTYARYLGLSPERAVKLYKASFEELKEENNEDLNKEPEVNKSSSLHIVAGVIALAIIYGTWGWFSSLTPQKVEKIEVQEITAEEQVVETEAVEMSEPSEIIETEVPEITPVPEVEANEETSIQETPVIEDTKVVVEFSGESWVEMKDKNKIYFQGVFHHGDKKEIEYTDNLFLSVGRPDNVKVYVKGKEKNILAKRRKMNIPLDSLD